MLPALVVVGLVVVVLLLARRYGTRGPVQTCCSTQRWPPDDLTSR